MNVFEAIPIVDPWKVIEHRHITQICNRELLRAVATLCVAQNLARVTPNYLTSE